MKKSPKLDTVSEEITIKIRGSIVPPVCRAGRLLPPLLLLLQTFTWRDLIVNEFLTEVKVFLSETERGLGLVSDS